MFTVPTRIKQIAAASVIGVGLAVAGVALPAQAADPVGAVTYSNFGTSQSGANVTIDFDYAPVDVASPGTIQILVVNYPSCASGVTISLTVPVAAAGHYHGVTVVGTANRTYIEIDSTDGAAMVAHEANYQHDAGAALPITATIIPDADPATGLVQTVVTAGAWSAYYLLEIDGVSVPGFQFQGSCGNTKAPIPYSGLAAGSTLKVFRSADHAELASFTNAAAPVVPPVVPPAGPVNPLTGAAIPGTGPIDTLAFTGFDGTPYAITSGIALTLGVTFLLWSKRRKAAAAN
jgi:hypothetical protein